MTTTPILEAAKTLVDMGARAALVKGGHGTGEESVDVLFHRGSVRRYRAPAHRDEEHPRDGVYVLRRHRRRARSRPRAGRGGGARQGLPHQGIIDGPRPRKGTRSLEPFPLGNGGRLGSAPSGSLTDVSDRSRHPGRADSRPAGGEPVRRGHRDVFGDRARHEPGEESALPRVRGLSRRWRRR